MTIQQKEALRELTVGGDTLRARVLFSKMSFLQVGEVLYELILWSIDKNKVHPLFEEHCITSRCLKGNYSIELKYYPCHEGIDQDYFLEIGFVNPNTPEDVYWVRVIVNKNAPMRIQQYFKRVRRTEEVIEDIINNV